MQTGGGLMSSLVEQQSLEFPGGRVSAQLSFVCALAPHHQAHYGDHTETRALDSTRQVPLSVNDSAKKDEKIWLFYRDYTETPEMLPPSAITLSTESFRNATE